MSADKELLIRARIRYPSYFNALLFTGTMSACLGVAVCSCTFVYDLPPVVWICGLTSFAGGVTLSVLSLILISVFMMRKRPLEASWVPQSVSPYEEDFGTDYYFEENAGRVYKPTTYTAPNLQVSPLSMPVGATMYRLVYGVDIKA